MQKICSLKAGVAFLAIFFFFKPASVEPLSTAAKSRSSCSARATVSQAHRSEQCSLQAIVNRN